MSTESSVAKTSPRSPDDLGRLLLESAPVIVLLLDMAGRIEQVNPFFERLTGFRLDEVRGKDWLSTFIPARERARVETQLETAARDVATRGNINAIVTRSGEERMIEWNDQTVRDADGRATGLLAIGVDVTARTRADEAVRSSQGRLQNVLDSMFAFVGLYSLEGNLLEANRAPLAAASLTREDVIGKPFWDAYWWSYSPDAQEQLRAALARAAAGETVREDFRVRLRDDVFITLDTTFGPLRDETGAVVQLIGSGVDVTDARSSQDAQRASEERFRAIFERSPNALGIASASDGRLVDANRALSDVLGYAREELVGKTKTELGLWNDLESRERYLALVQRSGQVNDFEAVLRTKSGKLVTVLLSGSTVGIGGTLHTLVALVDITERKLTESALKLLSTGLAHLSGEDLFGEVARQIARLLGAEMGFVSKLQPSRASRCRTIGLNIDDEPTLHWDFDLTGTPCEVVIGEKRAAVFAQDLQRTFPGARLLAELGVSGYAGVPLFDLRGNVIGHLGVMSRGPLRHPERAAALLQLFAARTSAEIERQASEARFQDLFEFAPDAIMIVDEAGLITMANRQSATLFGYHRDELVGRSVELLIPESIRAAHTQIRRRFLSATVPRQMGARGSWLLAQRKDGSTFPVDIGLSPMESNDARLVVAVVRDVTERVRAEEERGKLEAQLRDARKMEAIGRLAGGVAHDFNNLLAVVAANIEVARGDVGPDHPVATSLEDIRLATARGTELVHQILAFSRQPSDRAPVSLGPALAETARMLRVSLPAGVELVVRVDERAPTVLGDASQIQRLLMNLGTNARDALEGRSGRIAIAIDELVIDASSWSTHPELRPGRYARIVVSDTGGGMSAATRERVFEPFFTTKEMGKGSGLGLAVVHGVVQAHGGTITVDSRPDEGTTFSVYLPALPAVQALVPARKPERPEPRATGRSAEHAPRVLFLDDEPALVSSGGRLLEKRGYEVTGFTRPADALEAVRRDPMSFDVVVTDFKMPDLSGLEVVKEIRRLRPELGVVVTSGHLDEGVGLELRSAGVRHLLAKPWSAAKLDEILRELTGAQHEV